MLNNITIFKLEESHIKNLESSLLNKLEISNIQTYFPPLTLFFNFYNSINATKYFTLLTKYTILDIDEKITPKNIDTYIKNIYKSKIRNNYTKKNESAIIFFKINSIIDPIQYIQNEYNISHNSSLPNIYNFLTNNKINDINNTAYIDALSYFLTSRLVERGVCPTFPLFYGTFSGVIKNYKCDITEEYDSIKKMSWFKKNNNKLFTITLEDIPRLNKRLFNDNKELDDQEIIISDISLDNSSSQDISNNLSNKNISNNSSIEEESEDVVLEEILLDEIKDTKKDKEEIDNFIKNLDKYEISDKIMDSDESDWTDIESCSDISLSSLEDYHKIKYCNIENFPVQLICIEEFSDTLDNLIDNGYKIITKEWKSILFQIIFGLSVIQKRFDFVHNDLHSSNIMFAETENEYLYFCYNDKFFKIPTFNKITKIIDFGRSTFKIKNKVFFSDVFKKNGDAEGQYNYPYYGKIKDCKLKPNKSFDLARLSTTIYEHFEPGSEIYRLLEIWTTDKYGNCLLNYNDDFDLYKNIAKNVLSAIPYKQFNKMIFKEFIIKKEDIPKNEYIYYY